MKTLRKKYIKLVNSNKNLKLKLKQLTQENKELTFKVKNLDAIINALRRKYIEIVKNTCDFDNDTTTGVDDSENDAMKN